MKLRYVAASLSMFCFIALAFWAYNKVVIEGDTSMTVPLIRAPEGPYKSPPEEPGGMDIPHQDTAIYDMINEDRSEDDEAITFMDDDEQSANDDKASSVGAQGIDEASLLQRGFVLEPKTQADPNAPKIERFFDEATSQVALAKQNIEAAVEEDGAQLEMSEQGVVSDGDITSLAQELSNNETLDPEEVDAGIIISDPMAQEDKVKAPAPLAKPGSENAQSQASVAVVAAPSSDESSSSQDFDTVLSDVLSTDDVKPSDTAIEGLSGTFDYASLRKPSSIARIKRPSLSLPSDVSAVQTQSSAKGFFIQLASLPSSHRAAQEWALLQNRYPAILGRMTTRYVEVDLGDRGVYTRVQAGPYAEQEARNACASLAAAGKTSGCIVVKE